MSDKFTYVEFDADTKVDQEYFKGKVRELDQAIKNILPAGRYAALAMTALEEMDMWIGKALRERQAHRNEIDELKRKCGEARV